MKPRSSRSSRNTRSTTECARSWLAPDQRPAQSGTWQEAVNCESHRPLQRVRLTFGDVVGTTGYRVAHAEDKASIRAGSRSLRRSPFSGCFCDQVALELVETVTVGIAPVGVKLRSAPRTPPPDALLRRFC